MPILHYSGALFSSTLHESLAQIAGLWLPNEANLNTSERATNERAEVVISDKFPRESQVLLYLHEIRPAGEDSKPPTDKECEQWSEKRIVIADALGYYFPRDRRVEIYPRVIRYTSKSLHIDEGILTDVVLAHEIAHAVTHFAVDEDGTIWERFGAALDKDTELLAQLLPFVLFQQHGMIEHIEAMEKLDKHQDDVYKTYRDHKNKSLEEIRQLVRDLRLKVLTA